MYIVYRMCLKECFNLIKQQCQDCFVVSHALVNWSWLEQSKKSKQNTFKVKPTQWFRHSYVRLFCNFVIKLTSKHCTAQFNYDTTATNTKTGCAIYPVTLVVLQEILWLSPTNKVSLSALNVSDICNWAWKDLSSFFTGK